MMNMNVADNHVAVGGDFSRIFEPKDFLTMINIPDAALCVLRAHLILEEFLNLWSGKVTGTEDLYAGGFVAFKTKLIISKNLGLSEELFIIMDRVNEIRNRFSHRKGHVLEASMLEALKKKVDLAVPAAPVLKCEEFSLWAGWTDQHGKPAQITHEWKGADTRIRFLIVFVAFMLKFTHWIQCAFNARGISYEIVAVPAQNSK
ncbi:hypothetical protein [Pseudomonas syringae]|uniref:hypothetical protein n=1 Tax=Pseudomonas syringae TaxID=317 RepID=UPI000CDB8CC4|nr:hypothetical protein [Pseudomonas syringae]MCH5532116.1 hypothetical protein [Pseudomonas syringae pv. syringae]MCH5542224.1 hypothetical protein [Pseudomonas syringae pv. syringae]MCH5547553.1 hypothetical protein [Pseudomonas syringae pv. syringae]MCH5605900.1 hypothetical protein [Pseudomonas syringae pv. syringae]MCH5610526.1 hypothetical protein [Pseudomonas syringae pv. syringae]